MARISKAPSNKDGGLRTLFLDKLKGSKLGEAQAKKLGFVLLTAEKCPTELPMQCGGFTIPYFDINGKPTKFYRYRYLEQPARKGFAALADIKPLRYAQLKNAVNELYLPPLTDWKKVAKDTSIPIVITEGELKAACATLTTPYPTIGLGGVWCWKSTKAHQPVLDTFSHISWDGRPVYIVFDSDAVTNPMVMQAENALAKALTGMGAEPYIVRIPMDGSIKVGLDDYLLDHSLDDYENLLESSAAWRSAQELHQLNEEVCYVKDPGLILRIDNLQRMRPQDFKAHAYSTRTYFEEQVAVNGKITMVAKSAPTEWLKWPGRAEVERLTYAPGAPRVTDKRELNLWPGWGVEPKPGSVALWHQLLKNLFHADEESRLWLERWLAFPLQHPGEKLYTSVLIWGRKHGTGKSFIGYCMKQIYGRNFVELEEENLKNSYNEWAENKQFAMADEITGGDKRGMSDKMKSMITRQDLRINPKYIPSYVVPDRINWFFTSNHPDSFYIEDDDRRQFIHEVTADPLPDEFYREFEKWIRRDIHVNAPGPAALFNYLLGIDLGDFNPRARAPMTDAKMNMQHLGRSDLGSWVAALREDPDSVLRMGEKVLPFALWRAEDLLSIFDPDDKKKITAMGLARELSRQGFEKAARGFGCVTKSHGQCRLWMIREVTDKQAVFRNTVAGKYYDDERAMPLPVSARKKKIG